MKMIKKIKGDERGSILILVMLALVSAMSIAVAMSSISIVERKITTKSRKSTTAFQSANSGIEWAMKKINDADVGETVENVFTEYTNNSSGQVDCPNSSLFSVGSGLKCKIILLTRGANGERVPISTGTTLMEDIIAIRSSGTFGSNTEKVGRALEAYAMPNCNFDMERVADFCIDGADILSESSWGGAIVYCESGGKRLCSASELVAANEAGVDINNLLSADVTGTDLYAAVNNQNISEVDGTNNDFRCCRNR